MLKFKIELYFYICRIKITKEAKPSWPAPSWPAPSWPAPAWPSPQSHQNSWPSAPIPDSYIQEAISSWPSQSSQSSPPVKITHSQLPAEFVSDNNGFKKSIEQYLTTYVVKDVLPTPYSPQSNLNGYNSDAVSSAYNGGHKNYISNSYLKNPPSYGRNRDLDARRPPLNPNKSMIKKPFGQPLDEYETGKGSAAVYNENKSRTKDNNRIQFQNSVSADYNGGSQSYPDNTNNEYKAQNEINYDDNRVKSVSGDYLGSPVVDNNNVANNEGNYDENNELINEDVNKDTEPTYVSGSVPAIKLPGYKKKAKV